MIHQAIDHGSTIIENVQDLVIDGVEGKVHEVYDPESEDVDFQTDPAFYSVTNGISLEYKANAVKYWRNNGKKRKFQSVQSKFKKLQNMQVST